MSMQQNGTAASHVDINWCVSSVSSVTCIVYGKEMYVRCGSNRLNQNYGLGWQCAHKILVKYF